MFCRRIAGQLQPRGVQFGGGRHRADRVQCGEQFVQTEHPFQCEDRETAREAAQAGKTHRRCHAHRRSQGPARPASASYGMCALHVRILRLLIAAAYNECKKYEKTQSVCALHVRILRLLIAAAYNECKNYLKNSWYVCLTCAHTQTINSRGL